MEREEEEEEASIEGQSSISRDKSTYRPTPIDGRNLGNRFNTKIFTLVCLNSFIESTCTCTSYIRDT